MTLTLTYNPQYNRAHPDLGPELVETPVVAQPRYYTGIGSRKTPAPVLATMTTIARYLAGKGYTLRSGGASGADTAFAQGAGDEKEIYIPWSCYRGFHDGMPGVRYIEPDFGPWCEAYYIAQRLHSNWQRCDENAQLLLARNPFQVTGANLDTPSQFVVYYAPEDADGAPIGGTRIAVLYARELGIPTFNLLHGTDAFKAHLREVTR